MPDASSNSRPSTPRADDASITDIIDTFKAYARQELVGPLRGVGRWIGFGVAGALALGLGLVIMLLGLLRLLQTEWDRSASGSLTWLAYLITVLVAGVILAVTVSRIKKSSLGGPPSH